MEDVDEEVEVWDRIFREVLDEHCPVKSINVRANYTPWLNDEIKHLKNELKKKKEEREDLYNQELEREIMQTASDLKSKFKTAEDSWRTEEARKIDGDQPKTWRSVTQWLGWKTVGSPLKLRDPSKGGMVSFGVKRNCEIMNEFYIKKVKDIKENLERRDGNPCKHLENMIRSSNRKFSLKTVLPEEVLETASRMKKKPSMGCDDVPADLFLLALPYMLSAVTHIINLSLSTGIFPEKWKTSKIFPLHKGGDELEPQQYRPVSLLPIGSRLLEKIVCDQITEYLRSEGLFHCQNHGYRCNQGTITAVLEAY